MLLYVAQYTISTYICVYQLKYRFFSNLQSKYACYVNHKVHLLGLNQQKCIFVELSKFSEKKDIWAALLSLIPNQ